MDATQSPTTPAASPSRRMRSPRVLAGVGLAGWLVAAALAVPALVSDDEATSTSNVAAAATDVAIAEATTTTIVSPAPTTPPVASADEPAPGETAAPDEDTSADDPFAGMSDAEVDALSDDEFFARLDAAGWTVDDEGWIVPLDEVEGSADVDDDGGDHDHDHADEWDETAATFTVERDRLMRLSGDAGAVVEAERIWSRFVELIPADQRTMLSGFELMAESGGGGYVYPDERDPSKWIMGISTELGGDEDFVLIHEFAHLLTLQASEVPPGLDDNGCVTFHTGEGCALRGSTVATFVDRFWPDAMVDEVRAIEASGDWDAGWDFYEKYADRFVTDYAATNPAEDLAETFTVFVLEDRPTGDTIADQKVQFLWADPDMVELRDRIRAVLN